MKLQICVLFVLYQIIIGKELDEAKEPGNSDECAPPDLPPEVLFHRNKEGNRIFFECQNGYKTLGAVFAVCDHGQWSDIPPKCIANRCPKTYTLDHGTVKVGYSGALLRFECERRYRLVGSHVLVCDGRQWNGTVPTCVGRKRNRDISDRRNAFLKTHSDWLEEADYSCVKQKDSVRPPAIDNAQASTKWTFADGKPRLYTLYRCDWGYVARGESKHMYCKNGHWVGALPKCIAAVSTESPAIPRDESLFKRRSHGDWLELADYTCMGTAMEPQRIPPAAAPHGNYMWRYAMVGGTPRLYATLRCDYGYRLSVSDISNIYCREKAWVGPYPKCIAGSKKDTTRTSCDVDNGGCAHVCDNSRRGATCSCREGYELDSDGLSCRDTNECNTNNGGCEHVCRNTDGAFKCHCHVGYLLAANGRSCYKSASEQDGEIAPPLAPFREG